MTETLISFETAQSANQKGFNKPCYAYYTLEGILKYNSISNGSSTDVDFTVNFDDLLDYFNQNYFERISVPTQSLLQKYLREKHNCLVEVRFYSPNNGSAITKNNLRYVVEINYYGKDFDIETSEDPDYLKYGFLTYEDALENGLFEGLKLIENENNR